MCLLIFSGPSLGFSFVASGLPSLVRPGPRPAGVSLRGGSPPLRGDIAETIMGLSCLSEADEARVRLGNEQLRWFIKLARHCLKYDVPLIIEDPATSRLWVVPAMQQLISIATTSVNFVHCAHGARWMKPTRLVAWNPDISSLQSEGICEYSGSRHEILSRKLNGKFRTTEASAYPVSFCNKFAKLLFGHVVQPTHTSKGPS